MKNHSTINSTEAAEKVYLERVKTKLGDPLESIDARVRRYAEDIQEQKTYLWENRAEMDHAEKNSTRESVLQLVMTGEAILENKKRIQKLVASPYFGRFDFTEHRNRDFLPVYVGIHAFFDDEQKRNLIFDWRAPISTMFYDHEIGPACYESPDGEVAGDISLKRQFRIRHGRMEFMLESGLHIVYDVLQEELGRASDERMKNIVATIQRDQNVIIRNDYSSVLIIQGVAGSGKTSIALHRVAYLLYHFKDSLTSKDILIISPNRVFADYISNVLPELGEEQIAETEMEEIAHELLDHKVKFQSFLEQNEQLLKGSDPGLADRIRFKSSLDFLKKLNEFANTIDESNFTPQDIRVGHYLVQDWLIGEAYQGVRNRPMPERLAHVAKVVESKLGIHHNYDITAKQRAELKDSLKQMSQTRTLRDAYKEFYEWLCEPDLFKLAKNSKLEYADVFPLIHLKMRLEGVKKQYKEVKHLLVDEMQDYTPVQYSVIAKLFPCKKTILGDANQSVNPYGSSTSESIEEVFPGAFRAKLCKSYRSTYPITRFAQHISPDPEFVGIERPGKEPTMTGLKSKQAQIETIRESIRTFRDSNYHTLGVICKTQKQVEQFHKDLQDGLGDVHMLNLRSVSFVQGVVITTAHLAKGLEFDCVIVPNASEKNYSTEMDRNLLYVACTRAMHELTLTFVGSATTFIPE